MCGTLLCHPASRIRRAEDNRPRRRPAYLRLESLARLCIKKTMAQYFHIAGPANANLGVIFAGTVPNGPNSVLWTFFYPDNITANLGTMINATIFHEALHGYTKLPDGLPPALGTPGLCQKLPGLEKQYPNCWEETVDISRWIENLVWPQP